MILAPHVQLLRDMLPAAKEFMTGCASWFLREPPTTTAARTLCYGRPHWSESKLTGCCPAVHTAKCVLPLLCALSSLPTINLSTGIWFLAPRSFFHAQRRQHRNGSECVQLFATPRHATVHAITSRADHSAEAKKLTLQHGSDLKQVLAHVKNAVWSIWSHT